jgi:mono/diheme cytochrome c family protein
MGVRLARIATSRNVTVRWGTAAILMALAAAARGATADESFAPQQIKQGAAIYEQNCSPCHGNRMADPNSAFDLRKFPPDEKARFVRSVTKGLNAMPPWGDLLKPDDVEALWAYVRAGER